MKTVTKNKFVPPRQLRCRKNTTDCEIQYAVVSGALLGCEFGNGILLTWVVRRHEDEATLSNLCDIEDRESKGDVNSELGMVVW